MITLPVGSIHQVAVLGAHCDDIAIGMGATLLTLCRATRGVEVHALVLCGAGTEREAEERRLAAERATPEYQARARAQREKVRQMLGELKTRMNTGRQP